MKIIRRFFACLGLCLLIALAGAAVFASTSATITGRVTDQQDRVVPGAQVQVTNILTNINYAGETNEDGFYRISNLPPGEYRVIVQKDGFASVAKPGVELHVQDVITLNFSMQLGSVTQTITVEGGAPLLNTESATVSTIVDRTFVRNTPLNGRSFQDLILLTPGVITQNPNASTTITAGSLGDFSFNGQRTESNYYIVDGVTGNVSAGVPTGGPSAATSGSVAATTALGTTQSLVSIDALQEFRVQGSTYSAEYGHSPGAQISFVTRSGTNELHGSVFNYLRNDLFDANDWFSNRFGKPKAALRQNNFGGTLGGPVSIPRIYNGRDRTFFFLSYEGLRLRQPQPATIQLVPNESLRTNAPPALQPILNAFPRQSTNGIDFGNGLAQFIEPFSLPAAIDSTSVRLDHTFSPRLSLFFRFADTPSSVATRALSSLTENHVDAQTYTLGATSQLSSRLDNQFRLAYARVNSSSRSTLDSFGGATPIDFAAAIGTGSSRNPIPRFVMAVPGTGNAILGTQLTSNVGRQWNLVDTAGFTFGRHRFKFGIDCRRIESPLVPASPFVQPVFFGQTSVLNNAPTITILSKILPATPIFNQTGIFAQDEWRVAPRLNLSLGLRWEVNPPPHGADGNDAFTILGNVANPSSLMLAPRGAPLWETAWFNFAPRLGIAWVARAAPGWETVVRGGGGVFFDSANQPAAQGFQFLGFNAFSALSGASLPIPPAALDFSPSTSAPYSTIIAFPRHLQLPYTLQWNASIQQAMGKAQALTITYLGANGRHLIQRQRLNLSGVNPNFTNIDVIQNGITSNYQALQLQFQRNVSRGIRALTSYTWSHCLDFGSTYVALPSTRGNCDFDVRHNFQGAVSLDMPVIRGNSFTRAILSHWGLDGRLMARTAFPITLLGTQIVDPTTGNINFSGVNLVAGQPIYLFGSQFPGGRAVNPAAFSLPASGQAGNAPRNFVRGFGAWQVNFALRRDFPLHERVTLQFRAEAFNAFNHPNFGFVDPTLSNATFGQALKTLNQSLSTVAAQYQQGGPRSMQFALKLLF